MSRAALMQMMNGHPCARCGLKAGAHQFDNRHPRACSEWVTSEELEHDRQEADGAWMIDPDMEAQG